MLKFSVLLILTTEAKETEGDFDVEAKDDDERMTNSGIFLPSPLRFDGSGGQDDFTVPWYNETHQENITIDEDDAQQDFIGVQQVNLTIDDHDVVSFYDD